MPNPGGAGVLEVGRNKKGAAGKSPPPPAQYNVRLNDTELERRVHDTARALGLDGANFLRMLIRECLSVYERRAESIKKGEPPG